MWRRAVRTLINQLTSWPAWVSSTAPGAAQSSVKHPDQRLQHTVWDPLVTCGSAEWTSMLRGTSLWCQHSLELALLQEISNQNQSQIRQVTLTLGFWLIYNTCTVLFVSIYISQVKLILQERWKLKYRTFSPSAPCFYYSSHETLSLLSLATLVRTPAHTDSTHRTVLPALLTQ